MSDEGKRLLVNNGLLALHEERMAALIDKIQQPLVTCACSVSQKACLAALEGPQEIIGEMKSVYKTRRDIVLNILRENDLYFYTPKGAFYILIDIADTGMDSGEFALELLREKKVAVAPGDTFGETAGSYVRVSFSTNTDNLIKGVAILCSRINELRS